MAPQRRQNKEDGIEERVLHIRRVSKKTTGGNYISFSALVAVGDGKGKVGVGVGRGLEVPPAIQKGIAKARKNMVQIPIYKDSLPHHIKLKYKAARLLLKPAPAGSGLKVGGVARIMLDIAGVNNASGKIIGTRNKITNAYAVIEAIKNLKPRIYSKENTAENEKQEAKPENKTKEKKKPSEAKQARKKKEVSKAKVKKKNTKKNTSK